MSQLNRVAIVLIVIAMTAAPALAAGKTWYGRDSDGDRYRFDYSGGGSWDGTFTSGGKSDTVTYKEVTRTRSYVEIRIEGNADSGVRLYDDKLQFWSKRAGRWVEVCKGRWTD